MTKGFTSTTENQKLRSILTDIGLIIEFGFRDYREYLKTLFYEPMSIKMNKQYQPGWNLYNCPIHWFNTVKLKPCSCNKNPNCSICHGYGYIREKRNESIY